ncbi:hypothetical protein BB561_006718 [Smittium simulii]|uniref:Uncharacterized protein n=1 Tax=Smittium simulii TaxID=133385 RepID=A0A2T9Y290_9FUNG|nr:hypothetical protein BB561_006718 [Smittium simulii]
MDQETFNQIKGLTDKGNQLLRERGFQEELEDPYLIEALPLIEEDFFRSPLTKEKHKNAIKRGKKDRIRTDNPTLDTADDPKTMFANTMRSLLSEIVVTVTRARVDNLHKEMSLSGKQRGLIALDTKPLIGQKILDTLVASKKPPPKRHRAQLFCKCINTTRQQNLIPRNAVSSNTATAQSNSAAANSSYQNQDRKSNFCRRVEKGYKIPFMSPTSNKGPPLTSHLQRSKRKLTKEASRVLADEKTQPSRREAKLRDGNNIYNMLHGPPKELPYVFRSLALSFAHPGTAPSYRMGQVKRNTSLSTSKQPNDSGRNQGIVHKKYTFGLLQAFGAWIQSQRGEILGIPISINHNFDTVINTKNMSLKTTSSKIRNLRGLDNIEIPREFHWKSSVNVSSSASFKIINVNSNSFGSSNPKPTLLKKLTIIMGRTLVFVQVIRIFPNADAHQFQEITDSVIRSLPQENSGLLSDKHQTSHDLRIFSTEPSRRPEQADCSNRIVSVPRDIHEAESFTRPHGVGLFASTRTRNNPTCCLSLKLNHSGNSENTQRKDNHDTGYFNVVIGNMVFKYIVFFGVSTATKIDNWWPGGSAAFPQNARSKIFSTPHANNRTWAVNSLIQFANDSKTPLLVDSITRYIHSISGLINQDKNTHMSKGRAIEATLATNSDVSTDDIVSHAF